MKITFFSTHQYDRDFFSKYNSDQYDYIFLETALNEQTFHLAKDSQTVCVFVNDVLNKAVIQGLAQIGVKLIALRCAGFNNVDLKAAADNNIKVVRVPAYSPHAVAEHAVALLLSLNRKIHKAYNRVREGNFSLEGLTGVDLFGKTVGIIGSGNIGKVFANIMKGFGTEVIVYDLKEDPELIQKGIRYVSLEEIWKQSDIISLHCPLNAATHHLVNVTSLNKMKKGALLINTGRGGLIHTQEVIDALKKGHLGGLAIDVYEQEEKLFFHDLSGQVIQDDIIARLMTFPNVIITAHQGFFTVEALTQIARITLQNIKDFELNKTLINEVKSS